MLCRSTRSCWGTSLISVCCCAGDVRLAQCRIDSHVGEPRIKLPIVLVAFTAAILWIYVSANEIVALLSTLGVVFDVSGAVLVSAIARACAPCR
jgi:hypothetical protein